ncbi:MAG: trypsin-like peptidase domain-containing protein [Candidatus Pacebacteria bacterium]|nr:trypsin-like peptidase domain-containing protein [Candidatus Paceibacterota bacterium]
MSIYELPETKINNKDKKPKKVLDILLLIFAFLMSIFLGLNIGKAILSQAEVFLNDTSEETLENSGINIVEEDYVPQTEQEGLVISAVEKSMPSVVSILVKKTSSKIYDEYLKGEPFDDFFRELIPNYEDLNLPKDKNALKQIGAGTGFFVSEDGMILTNKHVITDETAVYSVLTDDGEEYDIEILAQNPVQDIAILKVKDAGDKEFIPLSLGDSSKIKLGQSVIAIGNALGEFQNSVSIGVVSGLERNLIAQGDNIVENLEDIIQTDAAINRGNSGGPLLNLRGEVVAINTAVSMSGENIGFAIPINKAKRDLQQVLTQGKIAYPFIGVRYVIINEEYADAEDLNVNYGAYVVKGSLGEVAIVPNSPADKAGIKEGDIILEVDGEMIDKNNTLTKIMQNYFPRDQVSLKVLRNGEEKTMNITLGDWEDF